MPKKATTPVRIAITSERYGIAASLFESVYGDIAEMYDEPTPVSPEEEMLLGIFADGDGDDYFVKPADPVAWRAAQNGEHNDAIEKMELYTEGTMTVMRDSADADGTPPAATVAISYDETELTGMEGATSTITYRTDEPGLVTMLRTGLVKTAMTFRAHHRAICTYDTPYMPFQVCIHALAVDNCLDTDGEMFLDYIIEIKGGRAERCSMQIKVTKAQA